MLAEPNPTPYDLRFEFAGIHVRVSPFFFLMMAALGYGGAMANGVILMLLGYPAGPGIAFPPFVALSFWIGVGFVSILLHELGHSMIMRRYGVPSRIVLYHFGGLAIPDGSAFRARLYPQQQMAISAAGPGIQLLLAAAVVLLLSATGFRIPGAEFGLMKYLIPAQLSGERLLPPAAALIVFYALQVNIYWALLNLIPIYPLDGGQISREALLWLRFRDAARVSMQISVAASIVMVVYFLRPPSQTYMALMFGLLGFQSFQALQRF